MRSLLFLHAGAYVAWLSPICVGVALIVLRLVLAVRTVVTVLYMSLSALVERW